MAKKKLEKSATLLEEPSVPLHIAEQGCANCQSVHRLLGAREHELREERSAHARARRKAQEVDSVLAMLAAAEIPAGPAGGGPTSYTLVRRLEMWASQRQVVPR